LTLSDCPTGYLGIAEIHRTMKGTVTLIGSLGRSEGSHPSRSTSGAVLKKELLFSQERPIVDANFRYSFPMVDILGQGESGLSELKSGRWTQTQLGRLPLTRPLSRDRRGKLDHELDAVGAFYSTETCRSGSSGWRCEDGKRPWVPHGVDRELVNEKRTPPWFSAAQFTMNEAKAVVITGQDGLAGLYSSGPDPVATFAGWGSEIASLHSGCGSAWQVLVTGRGDWTTADSIRAVEFDGTRAHELTPAIEFPGPVVDLHLSGSGPRSETDGVMAIVHNLS